jgi:uncharacterized protein
MRSVRFCWWKVGSGVTIPPAHGYIRRQPIFHRRPSIGIPGRARCWSDGNVGMIGISYFAGTLMEAAVERPPHLKAIMPIAGTFDLYESATHHGLMSSGFITPFLYMIGMTSGHTNKLWRSRLMDAMRALLLTPGIHKKFEMANGEAA